ncbi:MAG: Fe-S cluster assembly protein SufD, partial [Bacteroidota bacterium]
MSNSATFIENLKAEFQSVDKSTLSKIKQTAWDSFENLGFPSIKNEEFKYTNFIPAVKTNFSLQAKGNITADDLKALKIIAETSNVLVFVNGAFQKSLSHIVTPSNEAMITT